MRINTIYMGLAVVLITILVMTGSSEAKKKKRVIVKVPARIKHIYHHHTKNVHIHKPKPVVVEVAPPKKYRGSGGGGGWSGRGPIGYSGGSKKRSPASNYDNYGNDDYYGGYEDDAGDYGSYSYAVHDDYKGFDDYGKGGKKFRGGGGKSYHGSAGSSSHRIEVRGKQHRARAPLRKRKPIWTDDFESSPSAPWPEVKEHASWHQPRPQGFQPNHQETPSLALTQYHDTSIHRTNTPQHHRGIGDFEAAPSNQHNDYTIQVLKS